MNQTTWVGAVAYDPKVVTIWEGMRRYFYEEARLSVEVVLFQSYETQGALGGAPLQRDAVFGFEVVTECPGVPSEILQPRQAWADQAAYAASARKLAGLFIENFKKYESGVVPAVRAASPAA